MKVLGIDPHSAKPYGWAVIDEGKLMSYGLASLRDLYSLMKEYKPDLVAVEDQYLARNYLTAKSLSISAGKVLGAAELLGIKTVSVNVAQWKAAFHCTGGGGAHQMAVSMVLLDSKLGELLGDDEASAAGIAWYAWSQASRKM